MIAAVLSLAEEMPSRYLTNTYSQTLSLPFVRMLIFTHTKSTSMHICTEREREREREQCVTIVLPVC